MINRYSVVFAMVTLLIAGVCGSISAKTRTDAGVSPAVQYVDAIFGAVDHIEENLPLITEAAEQAADDLVAGGRLYAVGDYGTGFSAEAVYRVGGMMMTKALGLGIGGDAEQHDVVLIGVLGMTAQYATPLQTLHDAGVLNILFGSDESPYREKNLGIWINNGFSLGAGPVVTVKGQAETICPAGPVAVCWGTSDSSASLTSAPFCSAGSGACSCASSSLAIFSFP